MNCTRGSSGNSGQKAYVPGAAPDFDSPVFPDAHPCITDSVASSPVTARASGMDRFNVFMGPS